MRRLFKSIYIAIALMLLSISNASGQMVIQMEKDGGVYKIPCEINGFRLKLIFDTGASDVSISETIALMMLDNGYLDKKDIKGRGSSVVADGRIVDHTIINIRELKIESLTLTNVEAVVMHQQSAPLLLGQSAIQKLGTVSISGNKLILNQHSSDSKDEAYIQDLHKSAYNAYNNKFYELAISYFQELYNIGKLENITDKNAYAKCLIETNQTSDANDICQEILRDIMSIEDSPNKLSWLAKVSYNFYKIEDYAQCITTGQRYLVESNYEAIFLQERALIVASICASFYELGESSRAFALMQNEILKYLQYEQLKPTDCWDRDYKSFFAGSVYFSLACLYYLTNDMEGYNKYITIAAAWGDGEARSLAKELNINYHQKPTKYSY